MGREIWRVALANIDAGAVLKQYDMMDYINVRPKADV